MAFNLKAASDFWVRVFGDTAAAGDGSTASLPTRLDQYNSDMGRSLTIIADDGDLQAIDTTAETLSADPTANTTGAATVRYSLLFLSRWIIKLLQGYFIESITDIRISGAGSQLALGQNILLAAAGTGATDCSKYRQISITITPAAGTVTAGIITFEGSNDPAFTTAQVVFLNDQQSITANPVSNYTLVAATTRSWIGIIPFIFFRARISTAITGTTTGVQAFTRLFATQYQAPVQPISNAIAASLQVTSTPTGTTTVQQTTHGNMIVASPGFQTSATLTRPANVTPYSAFDVVGGALSFAAMGTASGHIILDSVRIIFNLTAVPVGMGGFYLVLHNITPPSAIADNAPYTGMPAGDRASNIKLKLNLGTPVLLDGAGSVGLEVENLGLRLRLAATPTIFAYLITATAWTPAAVSEVYTIQLTSTGL